MELPIDNAKGFRLHNLGRQVLNCLHISGDDHSSASNFFASNLGYLWRVIKSRETTKIDLCFYARLLTWH